MLETLMKFLKEHTKATVTVIVMGIGAVTLAWNNGCNVSVDPGGAPPAVSAPAAP